MQNILDKIDLSDNFTKLAVLGVAGYGAFKLTKKVACLGAQYLGNTNPHLKYTIADQPKRFAQGKYWNNKRMMDIDSMFQPELLKGKRVLVTGANRGIGLALVRELKKCGAEVVATTRKTSEELTKLKVYQVFEGIDVTDEEACLRLGKEIGKPLDIVINNAGYFMVPVETIKSLNFKEEMSMIDICALGPLRVTSALYNAGLIKAGAKVAMITSQGGSISWRTVQNPHGRDYGHHMSKAAANMGGVLLAQELRNEDISVSILHPGFNKTEMTSKYA